MYRKSALVNGVRVVSEVIPYVKSITLGIWVGTGSRSEGQHNHGISHFIEHMVFKGTANRSAKDIAEAVDEVGGQLNAFTGKEYTCYYIKVLDTHLELALDVLSDMLLSSKFDEEDINREREVVLEEVHMYEDTPDDLVHDIHLNQIWAGHDLGRTILGTQASIEKFDRKLIEEYYQEFYTPDNIVIAAAGNLTHNRLEELSERYFGKMTGQKKKSKVFSPILTPASTIQTKSIEQVHLCLGTKSVSRSSSDLFPFHILNNVLGGGISSRLFQSIREEKGLAYSIYSYQSNYSDAGLLTIYAGARANNILQVTELIWKNIEDLKEHGITEKELRKTKEQLKGGLLLGLESSSSRMSRIGKMEITIGNYITLDEIVRKIDKVSLDDLQKITKEFFVPETTCLTALGPISEEVAHELKRF